MPNHIKYKPGDKIGLLTIIARAPNHGNKTFWYCDCDYMSLRKSAVRDSTSQSFGLPGRQASS